MLRKKSSYGKKLLQSSLDCCNWPASIHDASAHISICWLDQEPWRKCVYMFKFLLRRKCLSKSANRLNRYTCFHQHALPLLKRLGVGLSPTYISLVLWTRQRKMMFHISAFIREESLYTKKAEGWDYRERKKKDIEGENMNTMTKWVTINARKIIRIRIIRIAVRKKWQMFTYLYLLGT